MALKSFSKPQYAPISACSKSIRTNSRVSPQDRSKSLILWSVLSGSDIKALNKTLINELNELNALDAKCAKSDSVFISLQRDCKCRPVMTVDHNQRGATRDYIITFTFGCNWIRAFRTGERPAKVNRATAFPLSICRYDPSRIGGGLSPSAQGECNVCISDRKTIGTIASCHEPRRRYSSAPSARCTRARSLRSATTSGEMHADCWYRNGIKSAVGRPLSLSRIQSPKSYRARW